MKNSIVLSFRFLPEFRRFVYGWAGLTVLVPAIRNVFHRQVGHSILAAGLVLAIMIFPTITSVSADAIRSVPKDYRMGAYGMGSTRWQTIYKIVLPASASEIFQQLFLDLQGRLVR